MASRSEIDALSLTLALRFLAMRAGQPAPPSTSRAPTEADARQLALRMAPRPRRDEDPGWQRMCSTIYALNAEVNKYEIASLQERALDLIPFDKLHGRASVDFPHLALQDGLAQALVEWAKREFLRWVDPVRCSACGGETDIAGGDSPTSLEREEGGAGRVELYRCRSATSCRGRIERFPRYTRLEKLLETRRGRCGEFAALFMLLLRALGLRARYIWNSEDHVWNEYYSDDLRRWVHIDSCEGARDKHLLYDRGWGKKMKYCIAFGTDGARDVTQAYVADWQATLGRRERQWELPLQRALQVITEARRSGRTSDDKQTLVKEDAEEERWLQDSASRSRQADKEELAGRTSGTKEWRQQRSELGKRQAQPALRAAAKLYDSQSAALTCNGSARQEDGIVALTQDAPGQTGSAFLQLPSNTTSLIVTFSFRITNAGNGADGMALVLHSSGPSTLGRGGCELGYGGISRSTAVEIDTYRSSDRCDDPPTPHISIQRDGDAHHRSSLWCSDQLPKLDDGKTYWCRTEIDSGKRMRIFFSDSDKQEDWVELTSESVVVETGNCLGWTASTGGLHQKHEVLSFEVWEAAGDVAKDAVL